MRIIIRPLVEPQREIDLTNRLVSAIAEELWRLYGGNGQLNWLEAELHLQRIVGEARAEADKTAFVNVAELVRDGGRGQRGNGQGIVEERSRERSTGAGSRPREAAQGARRRSTRGGVNGARPLAAAGG